MVQERKKKKLFEGAENLVKKFFKGLWALV